MSLVYGPVCFLADPLDQFSLVVSQTNNLTNNILTISVILIFFNFFFINVVNSIFFFWGLTEFSELFSSISSFPLIYVSAIAFSSSPSEISIFEYLRETFSVSSADSFSLNSSSNFIKHKIEVFIQNILYTNILIYYFLVSLLLVILNKSSNTYRFFTLKNDIFKKTLKAVLSILQNTFNSAKHQISFIWFYYLFIALIFSNLIGLTPASFTPSASLVIAGYVAAVYFLSLNICSAIFHKAVFAAIFLPGGTPLAILPFLFLIEVISYYARVASLSIRCFANLMSGHTLMHILINVVWSGMNMNFPYVFVLFIPAIVVLIITTLELSIGVMQAIIFVVLIGIYFNSMLILH